MPLDGPLRVVLTPEAFGRALVDPRAADVLIEWREGRIQPVVSRSLVLRYLRLLHRLGLSERTLRWWGWWLGSPFKVHVVDPDPPMRALEGLCRALAEQTGAEWILHGRIEEAETASTEMGAVPPHWIAVHRFQIEARSPRV
jgi:hypothetical protein